MEPGKQVAACYGKMRYSVAIVVMLGLAWGLSIGPATAQTEPTPEREYGRTIFDLFARGRKRSTAAVTTKKPDPPELKKGPAEVTDIAKEKKRLQALAVRLQNQKLAQDAEDRRLQAETEQLKEERGRLVREKLALDALRKSLDPAESSESTASSPPASPPTGSKADNGGPSVASGREKASRRSAKTQIARSEPSPPPFAGMEKERHESLKCKKAKAVIEGFAFSNVQAKACNGKTYLFSATRDDSTFSIKISPRTWELTEVSKLKSPRY